MRAIIVGATTALIAFLMMLPLSLFVREPGSIVLFAVFLWFSMWFTVMISTNPAVKQNSRMVGPTYIERANYYNTQAMRQDLDQMAKLAQEQAYKNVK